jgi:hypothetical protein
VNATTFAVREVGPVFTSFLPLDMVHARYFDGERGILAARESLSEKMGGMNFDTLFVGIAAMLSAIIKTKAEAEDLAPASIAPDRFLAVALAYTAGDPDASTWVRGAATEFIEAGTQHGLTEGEYLSATTQVLSRLAAQLVRLERFGPESVDEG